MYRPCARRGRLDRRDDDDQPRRSACRPRMRRAIRPAAAREPRVSRRRTSGRFADGLRGPCARVGSGPHPRQAQLPDSCSVRGLLVLGSSPPRLECHLVGLGPAARRRSSSSNCPRPGSRIGSSGAVRRSRRPGTRPWGRTVAPGSPPGPGRRGHDRGPSARGRRGLDRRGRQRDRCPCRAFAPRRFTVNDEVWVAKVDPDMTLNRSRRMDLSGSTRHGSRRCSVVGPPRGTRPAHRTCLSLECGECRGEGRTRTCER